MTLPLMPALAAAIVDGARECIDTPFQHQGRRIGSGLDCAGVALHAVRCAGIDCLDVEGYSRAPNNGQLETALDNQPRLRRVMDMQPGDILLLRFKADPQHLAVFTGKNIIHGYLSAGKCVEHILSDAWKRRIVRIYRVID